MTARCKNKRVGNRVRKVDLAARDECLTSGVCLRLEMISVEIIISKKGKNILLIDGYKSAFQKVFRDGTITRWKCDKCSCKAYSHQRRLQTP